MESPSNALARLLTPQNERNRMVKHLTTPIVYGDNDAEGGDKSGVKSLIRPESKQFLHDEEVTHVSASKLAMLINDES